MAELASKIRSGELADLLRLQLKLQNLLGLPDNEREAGNRELTKWLSNQPAIMHEALLHKSLQLAEKHEMSSTVRWLQSLEKAHAPSNGEPNSP